MDEKKELKKQKKEAVESGFKKRIEEIKRIISGKWVIKALVVLVLKFM